MKKSTLLLGWMLATTFFLNVANAELYKWTDENGNVHFSDSKPDDKSTTAIPSASNSDSTKNVKDIIGTTFAAKQTPISNLGTKPIRSIELTDVSIDYETLFPRQVNGGIGERHYGNICDRPANRYYRLTGQEEPWITKEVRQAFPSIMKQYGYTAYGSKQDIQNASLVYAPEVQLRVKILDIQINSCEKVVLGNKKYMFSSFYRAQWDLIDTNSNEVIYTTETRGYNKGLYAFGSGIVRLPDESKSSSASIKLMISNLLADNRFITKLGEVSGKPPKKIQTKSTSWFEPIQKFFVNPFKVNSYLVDGLVFATSMKRGITEYYAETGEFPASNRVINLPPPDNIARQALTSAAISAGGVITLTFDKKTGVENGTIQLIPTEINGNINWQCVTTSYKDISSVMPTCRYRK